MRHLRAGTDDSVSALFDISAGVSVLFEKEGTDTAESIGKTLLTWFSAYAQDESESIRRNMHEA